MKSMKFNPLTRLVMAAALAIGLAACGGGSSTTPDPVPPAPTPYEMAMTVIAAASTAEAAQAAYDSVKDDVTAAEGARLQAAVDTRVAALEMMGRAAEQKMALTTAAGNIDTSDLMTAEDIATANAAIAALKAALAAATDVSDADREMYQGRVTAAETAVASAQGALDHDAQTMALSDAVDALGAIDLGDLSDEAKVDAAEAAIASVQMALDAATELSYAEKAVAVAMVATANRTVMMAQGRMDVAGQMMALKDAVADLEMIDLDKLMTQEEIDAANRAIIALDMALEKATDLTDAAKLNALTDVTLAKRKVTAAETALAENVGGQRMALSEAGTALGAIDLGDLDTAEKIAAANGAVDTLKMALENATHLSGAEKAMYQTQLDKATETVRVAETGMKEDERMMAQRTTIMNAVTMAKTAVAGVSDTSTDSEVASAEAAVQAVKDAIAAAEELSKDDVEIIKARTVLSVIEPQLATAKTSRETAMAKAEVDRGKSNADLGKAMHAALSGAAAGSNALANNEGGSLNVDGDLSFGIADDAGNLTGPQGDAVTIKAGASVGSLGSWNGTNYALSTGDGDAKVTNEARVYTNKGPGKSEPFADTDYAIIAAGVPNAGSVLLVAGGTAETGIELADVMASVFEHSGTQGHAIPEGRSWFSVRGTFDGAPGEFRCTTGPCTSRNDGSGAPDDLGGTWHFKPDTGAMVHQPDDTYLSYGWWVRKDSKGVPMAASAFAHVVQPGDSPLAVVDLTAATLTGSATYVGNAAGKFAIDNVLAGTGNGGHFTADAMLEAKFNGETTPGVTGTIDNFRLNDGTEDPGWSVALARGTLAATGITAPADDVDTEGVNEGLGTTWSINGNKAAASGTWSGTMYDEKPGNAPEGDGSNIPTTVTGTFYSEFSTIGRMVGAFGATKDD